MEQRMHKRRHIEHEKTFEERCAEEAQRFREAAEVAAPGLPRELLLRRARQTDPAAHISDWMRSPGQHFSKR